MKKLLLATTALLLLCSAADAKGKKTSRKATHHKAKAKPTYYVNGDGTYSNSPNAAASDAKRPSPYKGQNVPENDGQKKNKERNLNYNNGQSMPGSDGK